MDNYSRPHKRTWNRDERSDSADAFEQWRHWTLEEITVARHGTARPTMPLSLRRQRHPGASQHVTTTPEQSRLDGRTSARRTLPGDGAERSRMATNCGDLFEARQPSGDVADFSLCLFTAARGESTSVPCDGRTSTLNGGSAHCGQDLKNKEAMTITPHQPNRRLPSRTGGKVFRVLMEGSAGHGEPRHYMAEARVERIMELAGQCWRMFAFTTWCDEYRQLAGHQRLISPTTRCLAVSGHQGHRGLCTADDVACARECRRRPPQCSLPRIELEICKRPSYPGDAPAVPAHPGGSRKALENTATPPTKPPPRHRRSGRPCP